MNTQFAKFLQIGIIVEDVEATIKNYEKYGVGPWRVAPLDSAEFPAFKMNGTDDRLQTIMAFANIWGFELELIQPISDSPYKTWLKEHGPGMHHIALITRDSFGAVIEEHKMLTGRDPWLHCTDSVIGMDFAYLDLKKETGLFLEVYNEDKTGGLPADFTVPEGEVSGPIDTQFAKFLQIGIIVEDVNAAIENFKKFGIEEWRVAPLDSAEFPDFHMNGTKDRLQTIMAFTNIWGFEVELIQPISDSPYKTWLKEHGNGMHHIALITRDSFADVLKQHKDLTGRDPWLHCTDPVIGMEFAYLDLKQELGLFLEVYNEEKTGGISANFKLPEA